MINWDLVKQELDDLNGRLSSGENLDRNQRAKLQKKASQLDALVLMYDAIAKVVAEVDELQEQLDNGETEFQELYQEEIDAKNAERQVFEKELDELLYPPDERDSRSVILEMRAGAGGLEAALFVGDLFKMYSMFANSHGWEVSIADVSSTDIGGYKEVIAFIRGKNVYRYLKHESGVHRVQRVPSTETQGRIHTSTVTVAVLPEAEDIEVNIEPKDLRIDLYRSGGAGGQHVNTTDSAVRITHIPTGTVVQCQDERSQIKNKAKAMKVLQARIYEAEQNRIEAERSKDRKSQVGTGDRSEKIRTYNYPQNRISDHRIGLTLKKLDLVMAGDMDDLLQPLIEHEHDERRKLGGVLDEQST